MDKISFKKQVINICISKEMKYDSKNKKIIKEFNDVYLFINLQKSNFCEGYYINYFLFCKELHTYSEMLKLRIGDLSGRFIGIFNGKKTDLFDLDNANDNEIIKALNNNIDSIVGTLNTGGVKLYLENFPNSIVRAPIWAKKYLNQIME